MVVFLCRRNTFRRDIPFPVSARDCHPCVAMAYSILTISQIPISILHLVNFFLFLTCLRCCSDRVPLGTYILGWNENIENVEEIIIRLKSFDFKRHNILMYCNISNYLNTIFYGGDYMGLHLNLSRFRLFP